MNSFPYTPGQIVQVEVYNPIISRCEWLEGTVTGYVQREDKEYGVTLELLDGRIVGSPYGAAPECVKPLNN